MIVVTLCKKANKRKMSNYINRNTLGNGPYVTTCTFPLSQLYFETFQSEADCFTILNLIVLRVLH